jgi:UDP-N-acetyl-2-amino-2-deoxyglucuronate dehydrogenase
MARTPARIKQVLDEGRLGRLLLVSAHVKWFRSQVYYDNAGWRGTWAMDGGGCLMNQSIHLIDLMHYLAGDVTEVYAHTATQVFANGAFGSIEASTSCAPGFPRRLELSRENGTIVMENDLITRWQFAEETEADETIRREGVISEGMKSGSGDPTAISHEGHRRQLDDLTRAILGKSDLLISGAEGRRAVPIICGIYESAREGKPVMFSV